MTDTPLYCECGNQLGAQRPDGTFVSQHKGRHHIASREVRCEKCEVWTPVDKLQRIG